MHDLWSKCFEKDFRVMFVANFPFLLSPRKKKKRNDLFKKAFFKKKKIKVRLTRKTLNFYALK